jgi:uncharacterized membrane protein YkoI
LTARCRMDLLGRSLNLGRKHMTTKRSNGWMAVVGLLGLFGLATGARAQESKVPLDQVPKAVMDASKAKFPGAKIREASKETEDGKTVFELSMTHEDHQMDVTFQENGTLVVVETTIRENEVPETVMRAVKGKYPGAKIDLMESVKKGPQLKKEADYYEFQLTTAAKKSVEIEVDATGKILNTEEK